MRVSKLRAVSDLALALEQAERHLPRTHDHPNIHEPLHYLAFTQTWSDTSCGFGGLAGQAFTEASVVVCWREWETDGVVFIGGRYAYTARVGDPRLPQFWYNVSPGLSVPGRDDWQRGCRHLVPGNTNACKFCDKAFHLEELARVNRGTG